jgi:two-component system chemotaxis response regulator CheB
MDGPWLIALAASAGGVRALQTIMRALPDTLDAAIVVLLHRPVRPKSELTSILRRCTSLPVVEAHAGDRIVPGVVYVARPDLHLLVTPDCHFEYRDGHRIKFVRSSANPLFESAAGAFDGRLVAVVLTGGGSDATDGVQSVRAAGGTVIAQDKATSEHWSMPESAIRSGAVDMVLPLEEIAPALAGLVGGSVHKAPASSQPV